MFIRVVASSEIDCSTVLWNVDEISTRCTDDCKARR